jgi:hypothetical protein
VAAGDENREVVAGWQRRRAGGQGWASESGAVNIWREGYENEKNKP